MYLTDSPAQAPQPVFAPASSHESNAIGSMFTDKLTDEDQVEILAFLAARPLHTVIMAGHIRDNGVVSVFNRGTFHGYRGLEGSLEGVALIGHATLMETRSLAALRAFARVAQDSSEIHVIMAEPEKVDLFWRYYGQTGQRPRALGCELLMEQCWPVTVDHDLKGLRLATREDLDGVMLVQAQMAMAEGGLNPLEIDPLGFRRRCARRIEMGRTWVWRQDQHLVFKVDILSDTPEAIYLEGIWVNPLERRKNYGLRCLTQVCRKLLTQTDSICVLVNEDNLKARILYHRAGFKVRGSYESVFLQSQPNEQTA